MRKAPVSPCDLPMQESMPALPEEHVLAVATVCGTLEYWACTSPDMPFTWGGLTAEFGQGFNAIVIAKQLFGEGSW